MRRVNQKPVAKRRSLRQYLYLGVIGSFIVTTVFYTVQIATYGVRLSGLEGEETELQRTKKELIIKMAGADSLSGFVEKSEELGFGAPELILYLAPEESVARLP